VTDAAPRVRRRLPRWAVALAMVTLLVLAAVIAGPPEAGIPLDPESTGSDGLRGVRDLLAEVGVESEVSLTPPDQRSTRVFVPVDRLGAARQDELRAWVRDGGMLIVADPTSPLHGLPATAGGLTGVLGATPNTPACDLPGLAEVGEVVHPGWSGLEVPEEGTGCFPIGDGEAAWLVVRSEGAGTIVALGSAEPFTNGQLDRADNAVLAAALLGPAPGDRVVFVPRPPVGEGDQALLDLVAPRVWRGLGVLLVALLLGLAWRGRRLGLPVAERLPPVVPAAELARSVAGLLQRAHSRDGAASQLRGQARREVSDRLGGPATATADELVALTVTRTGLTTTTARTALVDGPIADDAELVEIARATAALRRALAAGAPPTAAPTGRAPTTHRAPPIDRDSAAPADAPPHRTDHPT
jgi:hypothetical protein